MLVGGLRPGHLVFLVGVVEGVALGDLAPAVAPDAGALKHEPGAVREHVAGHVPVGLHLRGAPLLLELRLHAAEEVEEVLVTLPVPAGLVPLPADRLPLNETCLPRGASMTVRGDRVILFVPRLDEGPAVFRFPAVGMWSGTYTAPPGNVVSIARGRRASTPPRRITFR